MKNCLKTQHSKCKDHGIQFHHFMANRWGKNGNSERLYCFWLQSHCRWLLSSVQLVTQLCLTLCDPMNYSTPGLPVHRQLPEFTQTYVHWVRDAIKTSHPLLSPSWPALNLSSIRVFSNKSFFPSGGQSTEVSATASLFPMDIQDWLPLGWTGWISLETKGLSRLFSNTTVQKHQFFGA